MVFMHSSECDLFQNGSCSLPPVCTSFYIVLLPCSLYYQPENQDDVAATLLPKTKPDLSGIANTLCPFLQHHQLQIRMMW